MLIAISAAFILPDLPHNTRGFTAEELEVAQLRGLHGVVLRLSGRLSTRSTVRAALRRGILA